MRTITGLCAFSLIFSATAMADFVDTLPPVPTAIAPTKQKPKKKSEAHETKETKKKTKTKSVKKNDAAAHDAKGSESSGGLNAADVFKHDSNAPLSYAAEESLDLSRKTGELELIKNVVIVQSELTLKSDKANIYSKPGTTAPERLIARGHVNLDKKGATPDTDIHAVADEIEYFVNTRKAILRGKPKIWKGKELLRGEIIELDLPTEAIRVKNPSGVMDPKAARNTSEHPKDK